MSNLDGETRKFYNELGYSNEEVQNAFQISQLQKIDLFDALNMVRSNANKPVATNTALPQKQNQQNQQKYQKSSQGKSFLKPFSSIRPKEYQLLFSRNKISGDKLEIREGTSPIGLLNVSNCCYLNSLLQCYFLMGDFVVEVLTAEPLKYLKDIIPDNRNKLRRIQNEYDLVEKLKHYFTMMALSSKKYLDPTDILKNLVDSVGNKISYGEEKDLFEINIGIIERVSQCLAYTEKYYQQQVHLKEGVEDVKSEVMRASFVQEQELTQTANERNRFNSVFQAKRSPIKKLFYGTKVQQFQPEQQVQPQPPIVTDFSGIILNPNSNNLTKALDQEFNFEVELRDKKFIKHTYIREEPQYLFLYVNRTSYDRQEQQISKNEEKFTFDFTIYLDRYLEKNKQSNFVNNPKINQLIEEKNKIMRQINCLQILAKKIEECWSLAKELDGWSQKFPTESEIQKEREQLKKVLEEVETQLEKIESRKEKYHLIYIFVHRGIAETGHYWGYGFNKSWYRFDVNCRQIKQKEILPDIEKSYGSPYALLYVKESKIPSFAYKHYISPGQIQSDELLESVNIIQKIKPSVAEQIVNENKMIVKEHNKQSFKNLTDRVINDYMMRLNIIKKRVEHYQQKGGISSKINIVNNEAFYLYSKKEYDLCKFLLFEQSLLTSSNHKVTIKKLFDEKSKEHLNILQNRFKKKCKGVYHLKMYGVVGKQKERLDILHKSYELETGKICLSIQIFKLVAKYFSDTQKQKINHQNVSELTNQIFKLLRINYQLEKFYQSHQKQDSYLGVYISQAFSLICFKMSVDGIFISNPESIVPPQQEILIKQILQLNGSSTFDPKNLKPQQQKNFFEQLNLIVDEVQNDSNLSLKKDSKISSQKSFGDSSSIISSPKKLSMLITLPFEYLKMESVWKRQQAEKCSLNYNFSEKMLDLLGMIKPLIATLKKISRKLEIVTRQELQQNGLKRIFKKDLLLESLI